MDLSRHITFEFLPYDVKIYILSFLPLNTILRLRSVSKAIRNIVDCDDVWRPRVKAMMYPEDITPEQGTPWKQIFFNTVIWDSEKAASGFDLLNGGKTVKASSLVNTWRTIQSKMRITPVLNYCEFHIDHYHREDTGNSWKVIIGIVGPDFPFTMHTNWIGYNTGWGYAAENGYSIEPGTSTKYNYKDYGSSYGNNDTIGVLCDYDLGTISFLKNGVSQGVAYHNIDFSKGPYYFAASIAGKNFQITLSPSALRRATTQEATQEFHLKKLELESHHTVKQQNKRSGSCSLQ